MYVGLGEGEDIGEGEGDEVGVGAGVGEYVGDLENGIPISLLFGSEK